MKWLSSISSRLLRRKIFDPVEEGSTKLGKYYMSIVHPSLWSLKRMSLLYHLLNHTIMACRGKTFMLDLSCFLYYFCIPNYILNAAYATILPTTSDAGTGGGGPNILKIS